MAWMHLTAIFCSKMTKFPMKASTSDAKTQISLNIILVETVKRLIFKSPRVWGNFFLVSWHFLYYMNKNKLTSCWALFSCFPFFWFRCSRSENAASTTSSSPVLAERCLFKLNFLLLELPGSFELVMFQDDTTLRGEVGDVVPFELDAWSSTKSLRKTLL